MQNPAVEEPPEQENRVQGEVNLNNYLRSPLLRGTKRKRDVEEEFSTSEDQRLEELMSTPKKKKLFSTSEYIYQNLFIESTNSDIKVVVLGRSYNLHKFYLNQSGYFSAIFSGRWKDGISDRVKIPVMDPLVTLDAMHTALGSMYHDELCIEPCKVIPVLACASLLQLEGLIKKCAEIMAETLNVQTVVPYYEAADVYGAQDLAKTCFDWLIMNLLSHLPDHPSKLREIPAYLMAALVGSPRLFVMQTEFSVYVLLRLWVYLQLNVSWHGEPQEAVIKSHEYFQELSETKEGRTSYFLELDSAKPYLPVFRNIRLPHLINHHMDVAMLVSDRIVPDSWMSATYYTRWMTLLRLDSGIDRGPQDLSQDTFDRECLRCGRTLNNDETHMWRWTGFNSGLDLIVTYDNHKLTLKRNIVSDHEALTATHKKRHVSYRVTVASLNEQKQPTYEETSGLKQASLGKNESVTMLELESSKTVFPLLLSFNFCVTTPLASPELETGGDWDDGNPQNV